MLEDAQSIGRENILIHMTLQLSKQKMALYVDVFKVQLAHILIIPMVLEEAH